MNSMPAGMAALLVTLIAATGCADPTLIRLEQQAELPGYRDARSSIPAQAESTMRLYVYRPQSIVGMWGSAIVIVNGTWLVDKEPGHRQQADSGCCVCGRRSCRACARVVLSI